MGPIDFLAACPPPAAEEKIFTGFGSLILCMQRTGKPPAWLLLPSGFMLALPKLKLDPYSLDAASGELLQA